jgi:hypothetical protein
VRHDQSESRFRAGLARIQDASKQLLMQLILALRIVLLRALSASRFLSFECKTSILHPTVDQAQISGGFFSGHAVNTKKKSV